MKKNFNIISKIIVVTLVLSLIPIFSIGTHAENSSSVVEIMNDVKNRTSTSLVQSGQIEIIGDSTIYFHDNANLLTKKDKEQIIGLLHDKNADVISYNILFLTCDDVRGKTTMTYSDDYMDELFPDYEHNIAFVIDMDNREIYINTMGNAILSLTDKMIDAALDDAYPYIKNGQYGECLKAMASYCVPRLSDNPGTGATNSNIAAYGFGTAIVQGMLGSMPIALIAAGIIVTVLIFKHNSVNKAQSAVRYIEKNNYKVLDKDEVFVRSYTTVQKDFYKPSSSSGSSSSGGGSSHRSSSGRSHGGGGRSF